MSRALILTGLLTLFSPSALAGPSEDLASGREGLKKGNLDQALGLLSAAAVYCWFNDKKYSRGAEICSEGVRLRCWSDGTWKRRGKCR